MEKAVKTSQKSDLPEQCAQGNQHRLPSYQQGSLLDNTQVPALHHGQSFYSINMETVVKFTFQPPPNHSTKVIKLGMPTARL